ncbi:hypothetical protein CULT_1810004 [[Clostridium] ultunense Esp]|nr:hypothetical protein CULT_1810004 [[Clostridium] ultunense Esp]
MDIFNNLQSLSQNFNKPISLKGECEDIELFQNVPVLVLQRMAKLHSEHNEINDIRVYIDSAMNPKFKNDILCSPPSSKENLKEWAMRMSDGKEILLVMNTVERWDEQIARFFANRFKSIDPCVDNQLVHIEITYFIGNSKYTPFGVHIDEFSDALHFNLGPTDRAMYLWEPELYEKSKGSLASSYNPESIFEMGQRHEIKQGYWFFLPASSYYHIGVNTGFSISLAIAFIRYDKQKLLERALRMKVSDYCQESCLKEDRITNLVQETSKQSGIVQSQSYCKEIISVNEAIEEYVLRIRSNGGFRVPPMKNKSICKEWKKKIIHLVKPFKLLVLVDERIRIFARGSMLSCRRNDNIIRLIEQINSGEEIYVPHLIQEYSSHLNEDVLYTLLEYLLVNRAIEEVTV